MELENQNDLIDNKYLNSYLEDRTDSIEPGVYYKNTYIYGWGKNKYGELGLGHNENVSVPNAIKNLQNQIISQISSGGKHTVVLTKDGKIFICGTDVLGLLGNDSKKWKDLHKFQRLTSLESECVTQVTCAEFHSLCLSKEGYVYAWGGNLHNKLGQINQAGIPTKISSLLGKKIVQISCGDYHSLALSANGEVFSWGGGGQYNRGQCGHGDLKEVDAPKRIEFFKTKKATKVVCGGYHTIVLLDDNNLYGFGKGSYGQLGYGVSEDSALPKLIKFSKKSVVYEQNVVNKNDITYNITMINHEDSNVNLSSNVYKSPVLIKDVKCGGEHTIVLSSYGRVYTFGHGYTGQLCLGNSKNFDRPMIVKSLIKKTVNQIAAGWSHSMILTSEGNLYIAGCGKYGEIGTNDNENRKNLTLVKSASILNITNIYAGGHHSWLVTDTIAPVKDDFEIPSPLGSGNFSPTFQRSADNSPRNIKPNNVSFNNASKSNIPNVSNINNNSVKLNIELLNQKLSKINLNNKLSLQVAYSDIKMSHRFVRFSIGQNSSFRDIQYKDLNQMLTEYFQNDPALVLFRLQDDNEINFKNSALDIPLKDFKADLKLIDLNKNKKSYSLSIIYDIKKNEMIQNLCENIQKIKSQNDILNKKKSKRFLYEVVNVTEEDIKNSQVEEILSSWMTEFMDYFSQLFDGEGGLPRFLELRSNIFLI